MAAGNRFTRETGIHLAPSTQWQSIWSVYGASSAEDAATLICRDAVVLPAGHVPEIESRWRDIRRRLHRFLQKFHINEQSKKSRKFPIVNDTFPLFLCHLSPSFAIIRHHSPLLFYFLALCVVTRSYFFFPFSLLAPSHTYTSTQVTRVSEVTQARRQRALMLATRRGTTSFPLNSPLSIRAISRQRSDRYNRFGLIPVNCRRPKFTGAFPANKPSRICVRHQLARFP